jgi:hypothetical protein
MKPITAWCLGFAATLTFFWGAATFGGGFDWVRHCRLARSSATAEAVVTRTEPGNHCAAFYEFQVAGQRYQNFGSDCGAGVGDKLRVHYLPDDPSFSTLKSPGSDLVFMIGAPLALSVVAGFVVVARLRKRRS